MPRFGDLHKAHRRRLGVTLRQFSRESGMDAGYISRLERGVTPPPRDATRLAADLSLVEGSRQWTEFIDAAAIDAGRLPPDLVEDEEVLDKMPLLFRTARGERLRDNDLKRLLEFVKGV